MPALHIETGVREVSRNTARMVVCMSMLILTLRLFGDVFPGSMLAAARFITVWVGHSCPTLLVFGGSLPVYRTRRLALLCESNEFLKPLKTLICAQIVIEGITVQE